VLGTGLVLNPGHPASPVVWAPALAATVAALVALFLLERFDTRPAPQPVDAPSTGGETLLSFGAMPPGGIQSREEGMRRLEEELALAQEYGRPLGLVMLGLDASTGSPDLEDQMIGLEEVAFGAMRTNDIVFKSGPTELVLLLPETATEAARTVVRRIQTRSLAVGTVRAALAWADGAENAAAALEELESGLELCRLSGRLTADPFHLLV
jgi:hypothetical protein